MLACGLSACGPTPAARNGDAAARALIGELGPQEAFARLGWQQNPDYKPPERCFELWERADASGEGPSLANCEGHVADLARLYASYGDEAHPAVFRSRYYWAEHEAYGRVFPQLVADWEAAGGSEDDASWLDHPVCAEPLQEGWTGSEYFYDGAEHPLCRLYKLDPVAATQ
ncbi:hypothetical protein GCM10011503_26460 [Henriciella pelagia]|uniref:Uncharacterized protein n=2 Tax=Henriciella pelagia TaxID=1977912 RepID=A0ABQ1JU32_9PROT|nr:hypothetical protein GCM10011503_26460 [Henriciella pelagia]